MDFEIDDFYVGPPLQTIDSNNENLKKFLNDWLSDEQKFMLVEVEEYDE
jgi:hypothetical protein